MAEIKVFVEGAESEAATAELLQLPGVQGEIATEETKKAEPLTTVATIIGIVGGTLAIAEQIRKWYQEARQARSGKTFDVMIESPSGRILLEDATIGEIQQVLNALNR